MLQQRQLSKCVVAANWPERIDAKCDEVMEQFERRYLNASELESSFDSLQNKMIIVDLSDEHGPDFRVAKILRKMEDGNFEIHYYATRDKKASLSRRKFYPNWYVPNLKGPGHLERCTADPGPDAIANTTDFDWEGCYSSLSTSPKAPHPKCHC